MSALDRDPRPAEPPEASMRDRSPAGQTEQTTTESDLAVGELMAMVEELQVMQEELQQQNEELGQARRDLEAERERYRALFEFAPDGYVVTDTTGVITEANLAAAELLNRDPKYLVGKPFSVFVALHQRQSFRQSISQAARSGGRLSWEGEVVNQTGDRVPVALHVSSVTQHDGAGVVLRWLLRDVSERRRAEEALRGRNAWLQVLHSIDRAILASQSSREIAAAAVTQVRRILGSSRVAIVTFDWELNIAECLAADPPDVDAPRAGTQAPLETCSVAAGLQVSVQAGAAPVTCTCACEIHAASGIDSTCTSMALVVGGQAIGALCLGESDASELRADDESFLHQVADSVAVALHNTQMADDLREREAQLVELSSKLVTTQEEERKAIARELHDEAGQWLTSLRLGLKLIEKQPETPPAIGQRVRDLQQVAEGISDGLHRLAANLRPGSLDYVGLVPSLAQLVKSFERDNLKVGFLSQGMPAGQRYPSLVEITLFRVVQEGLTNVVKHAGVSAADVVVQQREGSLIVIIEDHGAGFDVNNAAHSNRLGLFGLQERVELLGGKLTIESHPGQGTTLYVEVPVTEAEPRSVR